MSTRRETKPYKTAFYPDDWNEMALAVKDHFGWTCQQCGEIDGRTLTVAHIDHDPTNHETARLTPLCAPCHLRHDGQRLFAAQSDEQLPGIIWGLPFQRMNDVRQSLPCRSGR